jgi:hypothetical protein
MRRLLVLFAFLPLIPGSLAAQTVSRTAIKAHIDFLADDLLEGRATGTRGYDIAAKYVATQFEAMGLETSFQPVRFRTGMIDATRSSLTVGDRVHQHAQDVQIVPNMTRDTNDVSGEVVFVGFGITAPELGHDDYKDVDVRGRIVLTVSGAPPRFPGLQRAYYSDSTVKAENAAARGAVAVIQMKSRTDEARQPYARQLANSKSPAPSFRTLDASGAVMEPAPVAARATIGWDVAGELFAHAPITLDAMLDDAEKSVSHSFPLKVQATIRAAVTFGEAASSNVIGVLRGSDPARAAEAVALTAHLDHLGIDRDEKPVDRIRNGALDNGSGIAALLEIARGFAAMKTRPARTIMFVAVTGEERGELGSEFFAKSPLAAPLVANVNMDMFVALFPVADLAALGAEDSTLGTYAAGAAKAAGFRLSPDPQPEEVRFIRSDQYSFVKEGIPAITFKHGLSAKDPAVDGRKIVTDWLQSKYHQAGDEATQKLDYDSIARWAEANLWLVREVANAKEKPRWNAGDFFGGKFGKK